MARDFMFFTFKEAANAGAYDERPILSPKLDLQMLLSRNDRRQPFFLICEHDTVLATMSGRGRVEYKHAPVLWHGYESGDFLYVPAGTPHRVVPEVESIQYRYKLPESELEGVAWYCEECGAEISRRIWETTHELSQEAYFRTCSEFNDDLEQRTCTSCKTVHPSIDLAPYRWLDVARNIRQPKAEEVAL